MISPWFQGCLYWKNSVILGHHLRLTIFSMIVSLFHRATWSNPYVKDIVFILKHLLEPSIIASGLLLICENLNGMFFRKEPLEACSFKVVYLFHITSSSNICLKGTALNATKVLAASHHYLLVNVLIGNFATVIAGINWVK